MRRVDNPPNPFSSAYVEWLGEPPESPLQVYEEQARGILSENDSPDLSFRWSVNPYRGCQHACSYCYARPTHEYLGLGAGTDFDSKITVKMNAPELLAKAFSRKRWARESIAFSGVTDCYQPLEAVYGLTQKCLEVCADFRNPVSIITKSYLIVRDIDVLTRLAAVARVRVFFSVPFFDHAVARAIETGAPTPTRRLEAMKLLHDAGIEVGVMCAPIIPGVNDREFVTVLERAARCGASSAGFVPLRLPGHVKDVFLERLRLHLPLHADRVEKRLREMHGGKLNDPRFMHRFSGDGEYWKTITQLFEVTTRRVGIRTRPKAAPPEPTQPPATVQLTLFGQPLD